MEYVATSSSGEVIASWRDPKRYLWLTGLVMPALPFLAWGLASWTGWEAFYYLGPLMLFVVVPVIDLVAGLDKENPPEEVLAALQADRYYRWLTYAFIPVQYAALLLGAYLWVDGGLSWFGRIGLALSVGMVSGLGINAAHELGHKRETLERWLSKVALAPSGYGHFYVEHNRGHHTRVSTPEDPASARFGESFYRFVPRTVLGSLRHAWGLEQPRFRRRGKSVWSIRNDVLNAWLLTAVLWLAVIFVLGFAVIPYLVIQAAVGILLLELVNYIEHYGLLRERVNGGRYEKVAPRHSWNSNNVATNVILYHLQRHSDHHANPTVRYQALRDFAEAPVMPTGYAGMITLALCPPLWFRVMDPRVAAHYEGDLSRANAMVGVAQRDQNNQVR